jgi:large subunit ribosomal protein L25
MPQTSGSVHHCRGSRHQFSIMATQINSTHVQLARSLPPRLLRFFARYGPPLAQPGTSYTITTALNTPSSDPNASQEEFSSAVPASDLAEYQNPFRNTKHPMSGKWHDPKFSLRRQAELVKLAREHGVEELLPFTTKSPEEKLRRRQEQGLRVRGTGVGQKVKGKWWERTQKNRLEQRRQAMLGMPAMIQQWKQVFSIHVESIGCLTEFAAWKWSRLEEISEIETILREWPLLAHIVKNNVRITLFTIP